MQCGLLGPLPAELSDLQRWIDITSHRELTLKNRDVNEVYYLAEDW